MSHVVLCELVSVLAGAYRVKRDLVARTVRELLRARHLLVSRPHEVSRALDAFEEGRGDFADYLIREQARSAGCDAVVTLDRALLGEGGFVEP